MTSSEPTSDPSDSWRERFFWAFIFGATPTFLWSFFCSPGLPLLDATIAAAAVGAFFGILAAVFGKRMLDFLMHIPW